MSAAALLAAAALAVGVAGCGGEGGVGDAMKSAGAGPLQAADGDTIVRAWTRDVYTGDYAGAARLFAPGAIVQQSETIVLSNQQDAEAFNRSLPCRAEVTGIQRERGGTLVASFKLSQGLLGGCPRGGTARVRFLIRKGLIETWRQLPEAPAPPDQST